MSRRDPRLAFRHMLDHAKEALALAEGRERRDFEQDRRFFLALTRLMEIVGEAANRVPPVVRDEHPSIHWRGTIGLRNRLSHGYDDIDVDLVWRIVRSELPELIDELEKILSG